MELKRKEELVESILAINKKLKKEELMEKSESELKLIREYELKLKEQEEGESEQGEEEGKGEVEGEEKTEEADDGIIVDEKRGIITMNEKLYQKFNQEIKESIYR